ncbi:MAG: hypothetical protein CMJ81_20055 [Planctomycetaceae bacterium]|nr:hypothetical protein [Planctomycetaceae bacterium]MBP63247.1 hypothetical protein [Planctomycetaceae bacterium]
MARQTRDRENLLQEATALVERIEFAIGPDRKRVVVGFRQNGACSFFFGAEPVYQFNSKMQLRRAYVDGKLFGATAGTLSVLKRLRQRDRLAIERQVLETTDVEALIVQAQEHLSHLDQVLRDGSFVSVGQVPSEIDVHGRVRTWLSTLPTPLQIADSPRVGGGIDDSTVSAEKTSNDPVG